MLLMRLLTFTLGFTYLVAFSFIFKQLDLNTLFLAIIPIMFCAWLWQKRGGFIATFIFSFIGYSYLYYLLEGTQMSAFTDIPRRLLEIISYLVVVSIVGHISHLQRQLKSYKQVSDKAQFDPLTGLLNRSSFEQKLEGLIQLNQAKKSLMGVLFVDLDRFKHVNDTYGHDVGDALLKHVAKVLTSVVRKGDVVARLGGDEFMLLLSDLQSSQAATKVASKIIETVSKPVTILGKEVDVGASVGISIYPNDGEHAKDLIKSADSAMYAVKASGRNDFELRSPEMRQQEGRQKQLEKEILLGFDNQEFELMLQPQLNLSTGHLVGFETLLRWQSPSLGLVEPSEFLPLAESIGLLVSLDRWVLNETCSQLAKWRKLGLQNMKMSVNISAIQLKQADFLPFVTRTLAQYRIDPNMLEFELSEKAVIANSDSLFKLASALEAVGVVLAIDGFAGELSLNAFQDIPFQAIKLDRQCLHAYEARPEKVRKTLELIAYLAQMFSKRLMAEGVETSQQHRLLTEYGYSFAQGYYYAKPIMISEAEQFLVAAFNKTKPINNANDTRHTLPY